MTAQETLFDDEGEQREVDIEDVDISEESKDRPLSWITYGSFGVWGFATGSIVHIGSLSMYISTQADTQRHQL